MYIEYPKALYRKGDYKAVADLAEQEAAEAEGFTDWHSDQASTNDAATAPSVTSNESPDSDELDRDALKTEARALGIDFARNVTTEKLAELIAASKE